ncbi:hypothetical protein [Ancylobacter sp. IITR112]|uniref:hypothetical protein n=1 Tax=Ancylobacter sp. IITR112 TaxID=3138073 RepID=UPI00352A13BE
MAADGAGFGYGERVLVAAGGFALPFRAREKGEAVQRFGRFAGAGEIPRLADDRLDDGGGI